MEQYICKLFFLNYLLYFIFLVLFIYLFIYGCVGSSFLCEGFLSSCGKWGPLFIAVRGPLTIAASPVAEHRLQTRRLSSCGSRAQSLCGMWDLPRPGLEPVSPALAGRFSTTAPPGKPCVNFLRLGFTQYDAFEIPPSCCIFKKFIAEQYSSVCMYRSLSIYLLRGIELFHISCSCEQSCL